MGTPLVGMVWAQTPGGAVAANGALPWFVPEDFQHFRATVAGEPIIVGRTTWESMPQAWRANRTARSVVISRNENWTDDVEGRGSGLVQRAGSFEQALALAGDSSGSTGEVWIMGGGQIYALGLAYADLLVVSEIDVPEPAGLITPAPVIPMTEWSERTPADVAGWRTSTTGIRWRIRHYHRTSRSVL